MCGFQKETIKKQKNKDKKNINILNGIHWMVLFIENVLDFKCKCSETRSVKSYQFNLPNQTKHNS